MHYQYLIIMTQLYVWSWCFITSVVQYIYGIYICVFVELIIDYHQRRQPTINKELPNQLVVEEV